MKVTNQFYNKDTKIILGAIMISCLTSQGLARNSDYYLSRWSQKNNAQEKFTRPIVSPQSLPTFRPTLLGQPEIERPEVSFKDADTFKISSSPNSSLVGSSTERDPRFLPLFNLVNIENTPCSSSTGENGTCSSSSQCTQDGGVSVGTCAGGLGTCCVFRQTCGTTTSRNCTYFVNSNFPNASNSVGSCQLTVNKMNSNICQLRLDFDSFVLSPPDTTDHSCLNDRFSVSGGTPVPVICGTNTGNHMYVALGPGTTSPVVLTFVTMGPSFNRDWKVKVLQIPCNTDYTAPTNCLQWFQGVTGQIQSYNYNLVDGRQLSNQDYTVCIRTEKNFCGIQYVACDDTVNTDPQSFTITGSTSTPVGSIVGASACDKDWLTIPCVSDNNQDPFSNCQDRICGDNLNVVRSTTAGNVIVYSYVKPFTLVYHTDSTEGSASPVEVENRGFCLNYVQQPCV